MGLKVKQVLDESAKWVGYTEKATNDRLESFTDNAGDGNWNIFAEILAQAGYYQKGSNKNGYWWCDIWVDCMFYLTAGRNKILAEHTQCQEGTEGGAGCTYSRWYYRNHGRLSKVPYVGDQAFFASDDSYKGDEADHTGLVIAVDGNAVRIREGNAGNMVREAVYHIGDGWLRDFGHPRYDDSPFDGQKAVEEPVKPQEQRTEQSTVSTELYTVQEGDTLGEISYRVGVNMDELVRINGLANPDVIYVGQQIRIVPGKATEPTPVTEAGSADLAVGDRVRMENGAPVYGESYGFADFIYRADLYVRQLDDDSALVSTEASAPDYTGWVSRRYLKKL